MRKRGQLLGMAVTAVLLLSGCGKLKNVDTTSIAVDRNGAVSEAIVEPSAAEDDFTAEELEAFIQKDVSTYCESSGKEEVTLKSCKIEDGKIDIRLEYESPEAYAGYHRTDFFVGTMSEAKKAGYDVSGTFVDAEGKEISPEKAVSGVKTVQVIVCREPMQVVTEYPILCVSDGVGIAGEKLADTRQKEDGRKEAGTAETTESTADTEGDDKTQGILLAAPVMIITGK